MIWFNREVEPRLALFYQAHEYAHLWLHHGGESREFDLDPEATEEPLPVGVNLVEGYSPEELREREANVYAREFLLPTDKLRAWYRTSGIGARAIANQLGLPEGMVLHQMARALLTPEIYQTTPTPIENIKCPLDGSQEEAAHAPRGPLLLEAGPGTGKTRTLVARIDFLLRQNVPPATILALTFSNRAAEEMRSRVAEVHPEAAIHIRMGTFHAFGLEVLRKYGTHLGLPLRITLLDQSGSIARLEGMLPELALDYYQNLYDPAVYLRDIMSAISRAKDELVGPEEYMALAERMCREAVRPKDTERAERAIEVARVYAAYQESLDCEHLVDFGDLISKPVSLLRTHSDVRDSLRSQYRHILVDEYQDMNRASSLFLKEVAGAGAGLWVVGDPRQAIYRFRGAAPTNIRCFTKDFPGAKVKTLQYNYRSRPVIVDVFAELAPKMQAGQGSSVFVPWKPKRSSGGQVLMEVASDLTAEAEGLAKEIESQLAAGIPYSDQAVLCRSHTYLRRVGAEIERLGVPVLYLGNLFERPEVRDMLSLLSLTCEPDGRGLLRVARFPEYEVPLDDVLSLITLAQDLGITFPDALDLAATADAISEEGKAGLGLLASHLKGFRYSSPWALLAYYLFERSAYLHPLLADSSVMGQQCLLALFQFLQFAREQRPQSHLEVGDGKLRLLLHIRQLVIYGDEKNLSQLPSWAEHIEAVRLLTVHASKGLEFKAVYLPALGKGIFPTGNRAKPCPPPAGMVLSNHDDHDEEEECLFFVALSRARDILRLSRAQRYGSRNCSPSTLLLKISSLLPAHPDRHVTGLSRTTELAPKPMPTEGHRSYVAEDLDVYIQCPRKYYYESVLGLSRGRQDSGYVQFHRCVYVVMRWLADMRASGQTPNESATLAQLAKVWKEQGPQGHLFEELYRNSAATLVKQMLYLPQTPRGSTTQPQWEVQVEFGRVRFIPDHVGILEDGTQIIERIRTGRPSQSETKKDIYGLYAAAVRNTEPHVSRKAQVRYLSNGQVVPLNLGEQAVETRLKHYNKAIAGILQMEFSPQPNSRNCPRCPHYFICPL